MSGAVGIHGENALGMTANAPKSGRDEIFIVLLEVLRLSPGKLLVVCKGFK